MRTRGVLEAVARARSDAPYLRESWRWLRYRPELHAAFRVAARLTGTIGIRPDPARVLVLDDEGRFNSRLGVTTESTRLRGG